MANRLNRVRQRLSDFDADAVLLSALPNVRWACGFSGSNGLLLVGNESAVLVTDGRYREQARRETDGVEVVIAENGLLSSLSEQNYFDRLDRVVFQADHVTVARSQKLDEHLPSVTWVPQIAVLTEHVGQKEPEEVEKIRRAQEITESVYDDVRDLLEPGVLEREIAAEITYQHLKRGAEKMAFDPIVASGPNGALPHSRPTERALQEGDLVVLDMGCVCAGYASDMTRTVAIGAPSSQAQTGYEVVLDAQRRALDVARAGLTGSELDAAARDVIEAAGFEGAFSHGLGHGIGLEVHEWPRVSRTVDYTLPVGACVTIEPGIYVPEEDYGVRIEDIVVLREDGCENLTTASKALRLS